MTPEPFVQMAQTYRLLSELEPTQLRKLLPLAAEQHFDAGQIMFHEGDQSLYLHLITSGEVMLESTIAGEIVPVEKLQAGEAMGWSALTEDARTHFQARALTPVSTVAIEGVRLRQACDRDPAMGYALMKQLVELVTERLDTARMHALGPRHQPEVAH